jgi:hypothetical protein
VQDLPLPVLLALAAALAAAAAYALAKTRNRMPALPVVLATAFVAAWLVQRRALDVGSRAAGARDRASLRRVATRASGISPPRTARSFAFIEHVRAKLPPPPARVYMAADAPYFRGRGAYHLYPHNVLFEPYVNAMPARARLHRATMSSSYQRRGVQYDPGAQHLRWDGEEPISAELIVSEPGAALFRIR